ncbi:CbiQ family ECF transporter T component [Methanococcoides sp. NM1]|uniref:CbiQ family ECF transporter T component n=1 Tax=Methanococcoides sp. NM1 TaxID=1201013 RepID=UPI00108315FA
MLLIKSYDRAHRAYQAMVAKGYTGNPKTLTRFNLQAEEYLLSLALILVAILLYIDQRVFL